MVERRRHYRTDCRMLACVEQPGLVNADQYCRTSNIGMKGVYMPDVPYHPVGSQCSILIHDAAEPLRLAARVTHITDGGIGFSFTNARVDDCLRLKHIVKPYWDGKDFIEGMMLVFRYSKPATDLKDCLTLTSLLSRNPEIFARQPHASCKIIN